MFAFNFNLRRHTLVGTTELERFVTTVLHEVGTGTRFSFRST